MTTWVPVGPSSTVWPDAEGYVLVDYVENDYVVGDEPSGPWVATSPSSNTWSPA
jgi:hypothetical protein